MINKDYVRAFMLPSIGVIIGEEQTNKTGDGFVTLKHPFRVIPTNGDNVIVAPIFAKEEWCTINPSNAIEFEVSKGLMMLYEDKEAEFFSSIIRATSL